jgi:transposase-like protein
MYRAMPTITEDADELKRLMKQERHPLKRQRLQMLYLVASEQAQTRTALAPLLGVNRETVGDWLQLYADGGRDLLLTIRTPPGKQPTIPAPVVAELREHLSNPEGVGSYDEVRVWLFEQHGIAIKYKTLANFLHTKLKTSPKVVRPRHIKKP